MLPPGWCAIADRTFAPRHGATRVAGQQTRSASPSPACASAARSSSAAQSSAPGWPALTQGRLLVSVPLRPVLNGGGAFRHHLLRLQHNPTRHRCYPCGTHARSSKTHLLLSVDDLRRLGRYIDRCRLRCLMHNTNRNPWAGIGSTPH